MALGRRLARRRRAAGLTQAQLADRMGTTQAAVSRSESGRTMPSLPWLDRFARATGGAFEIVVGRSDSMPSPEELRRRVRRVLGDDEFNPWERGPSPAERESLIRDGLTRERFKRSTAAGRSRR